jgi:hypothetical protein
MKKIEQITILNIEELCILFLEAIFCCKSRYGSRICSRKKKLKMLSWKGKKSFKNARLSVIFF